MDDEEDVGGWAVEELGLGSGELGSLGAEHAVAGGNGGDLEGSGDDWGELAETVWLGIGGRGGELDKRGAAGDGEGRLSDLRCVRGRR